MSHGQWRLTTSQGEFFAKCVILATGVLAELKLPDIPGFIDFAGPVMHTARWDYRVDLSNERVGVIGTGASCHPSRPADRSARRVAERLSADAVLGAAPPGHAIMERTQRLFKRLRCLSERCELALLPQRNSWCSAS